MSEGPGPEEMYRQKLASASFEIQRCAACGQCQFYPRVSCRHCGSDRLDWIRPSGRATVYSTTVIRRRKEEGGDYNVVIVELDEGPRMMSRVEGTPPDDVAIGQRVTARIATLDKEPVLVFEPLADGGANG